MDNQNKSNKRKIIQITNFRNEKIITKRLKVKTRFRRERLYTQALLPVYIPKASL